MTDVEDLKERARKIGSLARLRGEKARQFAAGLLYDAMLFTPQDAITEKGMELLRNGVVLAENDVVMEDLSPLRARLISAGFCFAAAQD